MQVVQTIYSTEFEKIRLSSKELLMLSEIGLDQVPTATDFVEFMSENYNMSQSGIWYTLKKLKKEGIVDFMERGEEYKPLSLTEGGITVLRNNMTPEKARHFYVGQASHTSVGL